jgi:hypothetical protein
MTAWLHALHDRCDSPTLHRDAGSLLSPWRLGFWFLGLNLTLGIALGTAVVSAAFELEREFTTMARELGLGQFLGGVLLTSLGAVLTLRVPLRTAGLFEGPRWGRYFDQLVLSGLGPERYAAGKLAANNLFFALLAAASLPYAIFSLSLGGVQPLYILTGFLALWLYANLLGLVTLAVGTLAHELPAALGVIIFFAHAYGFSLSPLTSLAGLFAPGHLLAGPLWEAVVRREGLPPWAVINSFPLHLGVADLSIGNGTAFLFGTLLLAAPAAAQVLTGPVQSLRHENGTFGEVVMKGDRRKPSLLRRRFTLRRLSEMCFFYENRSAWVVRREIPLRYGSLLLLIGGLAVISFAVLHFMTPLAMDPDDHAGFEAFLGLAVLLVATLVFSCDKAAGPTELQWGDRRRTVARLDTLAFLAVLLLVLLLMLVWPWLRHLGEGNGWYHRNVVSAHNLREALRIRLALPFLLLLAVEFYALARWLSSLAWQRFGALIAALLLALTFWVMLHFVAVGVADSLRDYPPVVWLCAAVDALTPMPFLLWILDSTHGNAGRLIDLGAAIPPLPVHLLLTALFAVLAIRRARRLRAERQAWGARPWAAATPAEEDDAPATPEAPAAETADADV